MTIVPLLVRIKYEKRHSTNLSGVQSIEERFADCVALVFDDEGQHFEYATAGGGRVADHQVREVWPLRSKR